LTALRWHLQRGHFLHTHVMSSITNTSAWFMPRSFSGYSYRLHVSAKNPISSLPRVAA
jgi:hypothetical protein